MRLRILLGDHPQHGRAEESGAITSDLVEFDFAGLRRPTRASSRWCREAAFDVLGDGHRHLSDGEELTASRWCCCLM